MSCMYRIYRIYCLQESNIQAWTWFIDKKDILQNNYVTSIISSCTVFIYNGKRYLLSLKTKRRGIMVKCCVYHKILNIDHFHSLLDYKKTQVCLIICGWFSGGWWVDLTTPCQQLNWAFWNFSPLKIIPACRNSFLCWTRFVLI